jgi:hypothetical protein
MVAFIGHAPPDPIKACRGSTCKRPVDAGNEWRQYLGTFTGKHETRHAVADPVWLRALKRRSSGCFRDEG